MNRTKFFYIFLLVAGISLPLQAQTTKQDTTGLNRTVNLQRAYNPLLQDASKINQWPEIKVPVKPNSKAEFSNYTFPAAVAPAINLLDPKAYYTNVASDPQQRGYLHLGVSSLLNIDGDMGYQILQTKEDFLSIYASHRSSNSNVKYLQNDGKQKMKINDNLLGANYRHYFKQAVFNADAQYTYSAFNYYGLPEDSIYTWKLTDVLGSEGIDQNINQVNHLLTAHAGIHSVDNDEINYHVNLRYTLFKQKYEFTKALQGQTENGISADFGLYKNFDNDLMGIGIKGFLKRYTYKIPLFDDYRNNWTISGTPYLTFKDAAWNAQLGLSVNGQFGSTQDFLLAPDVKFNWLPTDQLLLYIVAQGGIQDQSNYSQYYENRYLAPVYRVHDTKIPLEGTLGLKFSFVPDHQIDLFTGYQIANNAHFYTDNFLLSAIFDPELTSSNEPWLLGSFIRPYYAKANTWKIGAAFDYAYQDLFDANLKLVYYKRSLKEAGSNENSLTEPDPNMLGAWNKPDMTADVSFGWRCPTFPLHATLAYHGEFGRKAYHFEKGELKMKDIHDLSVSGVYSVNQTFSVFVILNNLLFQKYDLWYGYPAQNFNIMAGINVKF